MGLGFANVALRRGLSTLAAVPEKYPAGMQVMHWVMGAGVLTCVGTVKMSQQLGKGEKTSFGWGKGDLMKLHKSMALVVAALLVPRVAIRLASQVPALPAGNALEHGAAHLSHFSLYALMIGLPATGITMGYFGGKGLPFFVTTIPGAKEADKALAGNAFKAHKLMGQALTYLIPVHVGATAFHVFKGQNILARMMP